MAEPLTVIALHASGFEIRLQVASLELVDATIADLLQRGYRPSGTGDGWQRTPEGLPLCPRHRAVMRQREKQGDTWYSHTVVDPRNGAELYCRGYQSSNSPGWLVIP